ncbi:nicotinate-nucleotide--dimethylbenzimidazole phosphoribosyltransferase [Butyrivibrio sp. INlla16]|uniref:nicotinate-nucleotide--dimethylbenzimidazole phosphoribosyltransferase n=1 Tax=Butyrivibrio sp. INlla16 TaxID=1520807 RepID=UPI0008837188|nr:nicotinate-nucleotide--dimethylbenzimidazole phosphoribosyltransferase [Butyrivibrio sp. INlla16]SDB22341.1 nicotinate-nucleotide-dimethylbenzimidazole phosphoribosyltransferase [Butyrivibrio sp. INlla16]
MRMQEDIINIKINKPSATIYNSVKSSWDHISKPLDGLGDFEELICRIAAIQATETPVISKRAAVIFCADNGIVEEGISQSSKDITLSVAKALGSGISSACTLAGHAGVDIIPVDIGIDCEEKISGVRDMKISKGTRNFFKEPAMTLDETLRAIDCGINLVKELSEQGYGIISTGEMGIGNTTTSAAVLACLLNIDSDIITGRGAGLDDDGLSRKRQVIKTAIDKYFNGIILNNDLEYSNDHKSISNIDSKNYKDKNRTLEILRNLGGLDIAALTGTFIGGAIYHIPIVIDGLISATAALIAKRLIPGVKDYMIASHAGRESGCLLALQELGLRPYIEGNMALGEGTGALMLFPLIDMVFDFYKYAAKFSDYEIDEYKRF